MGEESNLIAYKIGNKVLKISKPKLQKNIPMSKYNVQSIVDIVDIGGLKVQFEIMQFLLPLDKSTLSEDEKKNIVYELYKNYRKEGFIWADPKSNNVGKLIWDNLIHLDSVIYLKEPEGVLKAGEYANLDIEYIYRDEDFDYDELMSKINIRPFALMEKRYQEESSSKK